MRLAPRIVGVEVSTSFRLWKVALRFRASLTGSHSAPADGGYRSTSSAKTTRMGRDARLLGLFDPAIVTCPPGKDVCNVVFPLSHDLGSLILIYKHVVSGNIVARRSFENACAISRVGCKTRIGEGSCAM